MIASTAILFLLAALPEQASRTDIHFECRTDDGISFSVFGPGAPVGAGASENQESLYRTMGLAGTGSVDAVIDTLPDSLTLIWNSEDSVQITLDILRYDPEAETAQFRIRRESDPDAPIVTVTASDGFCVSRPADRNTLVATEEIEQ